MSDQEILKANLLEMGLTDNDKVQSQHYSCGEYTATIHLESILKEQRKQPSPLKGK